MKRKRAYGPGDANPAAGLDRLVVALPVRTTAMTMARRSLLLLALACAALSRAGGASACAALLVDDCEGGGLHGAWVVYAAPGCSMAPAPFAFAAGGYRSVHCARLQFAMGSSAHYAYAGMGVSFPAVDASSYEGVRFRAKGQGAWSCQVPTQATASTYNHYQSPFAVSADWRFVEIPFSRLAQMRAPRSAWDASAVVGVHWTAAGFPGTKGWLCVDDVALYRKADRQLPVAEANPILPEPKVNQLGYMPAGPKWFAVTARPGGPKKGDKFTVVAEKGEIAYAGRLATDPIDDAAATGEHVLRGDFTSLRRPGTYRVEVGGARSQPFAVRAGLYGPLYRDALRCFYLIRCGVAADDPVTGIAHGACHQGDAVDKQTGERADLTGGWHNADDYGKWVPEAAVSCAWMMWLHELRPRPGDVDGLAEAPAGRDGGLLAQARWGLDWMLKMQRPDGSVLHKVDAEDHFCPATPPERDPYPRYYKPGGSIDAADFVGAMCQAARVYRRSDPAFADRCRAAARRAWAWLERHPKVVRHDPDYVDDDPSQERLWALGEMARTTGAPRLLARFAREATPDRLRAATWQAPQLFGYLAVYSGPQTPAAEKDVIRSALRRRCDALVARARASGYGVVTAPAEYCWESNEVLLDRAGLLLIGYAATHDAAYRDTAIRQMDWLLGANALGFSFVTGYGSRSVRHPFHWTSTALHRLMPGWATGGPNQYAKGADSLLMAAIRSGRPPAKCYVDANTANGSWASNEGETSENAALVFCAGYLSDE